ncbi:hypothetical protein [Pseudoxanthomonas putridarboris]|uniref:Lipoprotein n=1 Tax=Pseudoxanthomonas putridarboris TaxID=752605 RepID=A0ABU9IVM3_9GAMM
MRILILPIALTLVACTHQAGGLARDSAPECADVAEKARAHDKANKDYESIRQRTVETPTEQNQRKLAAAATDTAKAAADLSAAEAGAGAHCQRSGN